MGQTQKDRTKRATGRLTVQLYKSRHFIDRCIMAWQSTERGMTGASRMNVFNFFTLFFAVPRFRRVSTG